MIETFTNVRLFDGDRLLEGTWDVQIDGETVGAVSPAGSASARGAVVDGGGATTLLPGLIDAHVHLRSIDDVHTLARFGVTTALDMGSSPPALIDELRSAGSTDVRSTGAAAVGPESLHVGVPGRPRDSIVADPEDGRRFVAARVAEGMDYIKVIADAPGGGGVDADTMAAIVQAAHKAGRMVVAHAARMGAVRLAHAAGVDVLTHSPLDGELDDAEIDDVVRAGRTVVPTLLMVQGVAANAPVPGLEYRHARSFVSALHRAGAAIVLGTDANQAPQVPANVPYGDSVHTRARPPSRRRAHADRGASRRHRSSGGPVRTVRSGPDQIRTAAPICSSCDGDPTSDIAASRAVRTVRIAGRDG